MIKSKELAGPSCLTNADDDEPLFVLRANDELAPEVVRVWARAYKGAKECQPRGMTAKQRAKYEEALLCADLMAAWRVRKAAELDDARFGSARAIRECNEHAFAVGPGDFGDGRVCMNCGAVEQQ